MASGSGARAGAAATPAPRGTVSFEVRSGGQGFAYSLPPSSLATFKWVPGKPAVAVWRTTAATSGTGLTERLAPGSATFAPATALAPAIDVNPSVGYQTIDGFGGALTDSSAALIAASPARAQILSDLFSPAGARFTFVRLPMGASDFIADPRWQSYDDATDPTLARFSVAHDTAATIPILQQARKLSPQLELLATPWSAPGWMKFGHSFDGSCSGANNFLQNVYYATYAQYFVKFVQSYQNTYGLPIQMVSLENEPDVCNPSYPTMTMSATDQATLALALRDALDAAGLGSVRVLAGDASWADTLPVQVLRVGASVRSAIAAIGYHCYAGDPSAQLVVHAVFPSTDVYLTECSGGGWSTVTAANLVWEVRNSLIEPLRDWARASTYLNLALDPTGGPHSGGCPNCRGMLTIDNAAGTYTANEDYYYWAQFSKFVDPGAKRIDSPDLASPSIQTVAFKNPDGSIVLVALNSSAP